MGTAAGACREWLRYQACLFCGRYQGSDPHHVKTRGSGGIDENNLVPACRECHDRVQGMTLAAVKREFGLDLVAHAKEYWACWLDEAARLHIGVYAERDILFPTDGSYGSWTPTIVDADLIDEPAKVKRLVRRIRTAPAVAAARARLQRSVP